MVYYPLGVDRRRVKTYKVLKPSGFLFRNPRQHGAWRRAMDKFADATSCGLELLALRRGSPGRREGSIADVAGAVYRQISAGETTPSKALNLTRFSKEVGGVQAGHHREVLARKADVERELIRTLDAGSMEEVATRTGLFIQADDFPHLF